MYEVLTTKDVPIMYPNSPQIRHLLQNAYQNNQVTTLTLKAATYTGNIDFITDSTVYLGLTAGRSLKIPLADITHVQLHQLQSWWHLYEHSS